MAITTSSIKCICYSILVLYMLLFSIPLLQCSPSDCLEEEGLAFTDSRETSLVSPGGVFEFGFFSPDEKTKNRRYLGIWYHNQSNPKIIVWVANRDKPLLDSKGSLKLQNGNAKLLGRKGVAYWSTIGEPSEQVQTMGTSNSSNATSNDRVHLQLLHAIKYAPRNPAHAPSFATKNTAGNVTRLCLFDSGNLKLYDRKVQISALWQSFKHPTDTFLPGMIQELDLSSSSLSLVSWQTHNNPARGKFTFPLQPNISNDLVIFERGVQNYWQSGTTPFDKIPSVLYGLWFNNSYPPLQNNTRLVMNFTGQIQFWNWEYERGWNLSWTEPKDGCSLYDKCGQFGSCNSNNGLSCKCLPGFKPSARWNLGETSGGCTRKSGSFCDRNDTSNDIFLTLPMMKLGNQTCKTISSEDNCSVQCLNDCDCVAYSYGLADCSGVGTLNEKRCLTWRELTDLQESSDGITISVRTTQADIDPTSRGCRPCGTYIIPYPLSTGSGCGDPSYSNFHCNHETGQVNFSLPNGNFIINSVDPDKKLFSIQVMHNSCDFEYIQWSVLSPNESLPFTFKNCNVVKDQPLILFKQPFIEVEIGWKPPPEFTCLAPSDCNHWPHTNCKPKNGGKMRCICGANFRWNGLTLQCTREVPFLLKVVVPCIAGALAIILLCCIFSVYHMRKRRMLKGRDSFELNGDDTEGIDVPLFNWENILAATNNFADTNKLGTGGFGSVYRGDLPDGQKIAVKRLSNVTMEGIAEFRTEVILISKLQHRNLVRLIGYCTKADEKILIYEYMPNGSLDSCLFDERHSVYLDWKKRFDIILGIARGLLYLHQDSRLRIIHRDLKPSNVLLDEELNPKISDFGIARIVGGKDTEASTGRVVGT